jgi:Domain of unknown function (DUF4383)
MNTATMAMVFGVVFVVAGLAGFAASPPPAGAPPLVIESGHGLALGLFPVNTVHNLVHLLFGALGIAAGMGAVLSAGSYFRIVAVSYALLTVLGLISATNTVFGLVPIWGFDVWLHGLLAVAAAYLGFAVASPSRA